jgi:voltage-gated potassium channel
VVIYKISRLLAAVFFRASLSLILVSFLAFGLSSYLLLFFAGEKELVTADNFIYWLVVTASTVGYGDLSPSTAMGKMAVSLWVIPLGLSLFALLLTRVGFFLSSFLLRGKKGLRMLHIKNHCVIIGWNAARTLRLIELLLSSPSAHKERILLCVAVDIENPLPDLIDFVRVETFSHADTMARANLAAANRIIIDTPMDDVTLTTALYCDKICPNSHKTVYFQDESVGELLHAHCPNIEIIPSVSVEMLARSSLDPGSALLHKQLLDTTYGMSQYCIYYAGQAPLIFEELFLHFKTELSATVIGVRRQNDAQINLNPSLDFNVNAGDGVYYIAASRLLEKDCFNFE